MGGVTNKIGAMFFTMALRMPIVVEWEDADVRECVGDATRYVRNGAGQVGTACVSLNRLPSCMVNWKVTRQPARTCAAVVVNRGERRHERSAISMAIQGRISAR